MPVAEVRRPPGGGASFRKIAGGLKSWRWPVVIVGTAVAGIVITGLALRRAPPPDEEPDRRPEIARHFEAGQRALAAGAFMLAAQELDAARTLHQQASRFPFEKSRDLVQNQRQASLLSELLDQPIEDIIRQASELNGLDQREWQSVFAQRYRGRSVVFDAEVRRDALGKYHVDYAIFFRGKRATIDLGSAPLFEVIPWHGPQRLLFGVRLAEIVPGDEGIWTVRFDPESAVLLTDLGAATAVCGQASGELRDVVLRQAEWLARLP
jgi:hypothetical protein